MAKPTGYKANRKSIAQRRREARERIWNKSDVPQFWEDSLASKNDLRALLEKDWRIEFNQTCPDHQT